MANIMEIKGDIVKEIDDKEDILKDVMVIKTQFGPLFCQHWNL